ncbi:agarase [Blastochloris sulfoviridis]|uniref:Agarase n=1 Tax=Blastochloris sulfoviridis TaxID=50712 RepID=A0A5M6I085_9HYPH|nr:agarase [Blastochloris sulfoviridis]KAA5601229.1 agarase [Blastochloris sulfoviridis]
MTETFTTAPTRWGGRRDGRVAATGFFGTACLDGVWWLVDPEGGLLLSKGVNNVRIDPDFAGNTDRVPYAEACLGKYGSANAWRQAAAARLASWGVNTVGAWSDEAVAASGPTPLALTPLLDLGQKFAFSFAGPSLPWGDAFPDVFDPRFAPFVRQRAEALCGPHRDDPAVLGWFADNELRWGPDWRGRDELLTLFLKLPPGRPGRQAAVAHLRRRYPDFASFDAIWRTRAGAFEALETRTAPVEQPYPRPAVYDRDPAFEARLNRLDPDRAAFVADCDAFAAEIARRYFGITTAVLRTVAPNHLALGCRFHYPPQAEVIAEAGRDLDVVSFNCYVADPVAAIATYASAGRPLLIGEFSVRGDDAGLPNTRGAAPRVATQAERAATLRQFVTAALKQPALVGYHWFEHADQPAEGRPDGENSNYGTVTIRDDPYPELTAALTGLNAEAETVHRTAPPPLVA